MDDVLAVFEGLNDDELNALRARIVPTLQNLRREITTGAKMLPDIDIDALTEDQRARLREKVDAAIAEITAPPGTEAQEETEIAALPRGLNNALQRRNIRAKYAAMRAQAEPGDPELDAAADNRLALRNLYAARLKKIRRGDLQSVSHLQFEFRKRGLDV